MQYIKYSFKKYRKKNNHYNILMTNVLVKSNSLLQLIILYDYYYLLDYYLLTIID